MNPWLGILLILATLAVSMAALQGLRRLRPIAPEVSRKAVHVGMGLVCLSFPWLFA